MRTKKTKNLYDCMSLLALSILVLSSCISQKELTYLQDPVLDANVYTLREKEEIRIKPNDELYIRVSSFDDVAYNFFSSQTNTSALSFGTEASISLVSYSVNDSGNIYFPILGHVYVKDLTIDSATTKLRNLLSEYFNQPAVLIKFVNQKITVIGEVRQPGSYTYTKDRITIFEALSMAGDITLHGNRKNVYLIRNVNESVVKTKLDLTKDTEVFNKNYYLMARDIVYVQPKGSLTWSSTYVPASLVLTSLTTFVLILNYLR